MSQLDDRSPITSDTADGAQRPEDPGVAHESPSGAATPPSSSGRTWLLVLAAGLLGGLAGFATGEAGPNYIRPSYELSPELRRNSTQIPIEIERRKGIARDQIASLAYGALGMVLGLALGVAGGLTRRAPVAAIAAGVTGLVLGGAAGAGTTMVLLPSYHAIRAAAADENYNEDMALALRTHGGIWIAIGAAAGLAFGIGLGNWTRMARAVIGGILGAGLAAAIYEFGGAFLFPLAATARPMAADVIPRLFAHLTVALCVAAGALLFANHLTLHRAKPQPNR
jgi:hypothetical protein